MQPCAASAGDLQRTDVHRATITEGDKVRAAVLVEDLRDKVGQIGKRPAKSMARSAEPENDLSAIEDNSSYSVAAFAQGAGEACEEWAGYAL